MKHPFRVLSIDFDYFQNATVQQLYCYPDGLDLPTSLSTYVWVSHYSQARTRETLEQVTADEKGLALLRKVLLKNSKTEKPVMIVQSHKLIYDFVMDNYELGDYDGLSLINVDMHPDYKNNNDREVDCGNWVSFLEKEFEGNFDFTWVANKVSEEMFPAPEELKGRTTQSLDILKDKEFDAIFICRSDNWLPPHLDSHFDKLFNFCIEMFGRALVDGQITTPREYMEQVKQMEEVYANLNKVNEKQRKGELP